MTFNARRYAQVRTAERLAEKAVYIQCVATDPMASIPKASLGWSETVATYRFFDNDSVVETLQLGTKLGTIEKLERALALFMVVGWRIAYLMRSGRTCLYGKERQRRHRHFLGSATPARCS